MNSDYSGSFTRNPEAGAVLRPHNNQLKNVLVPSSAYNNYDNAKFRPSNPQVVQFLKHHATDFGREANQYVVRDKNRLRIGNTGHGGRDLGGGALMKGGDAGDVASTVLSILPFFL